MALLARHTDTDLEAGVDEAGRGCLAGPVVAAAVILPRDFSHPGLDDSKKLSSTQRDHLRPIIETEALAWHVGFIPPERIDQINILNATFEAMHLAIAGLGTRPGHLLIDGNRFRPFDGISHDCIIKGDGIYLSIAAASVLAKTWRDEYMARIDADFPEYAWSSNKGYPTAAHKDAIHQHGLSPHHRQTFNWRR